MIKLYEYNNRNMCVAYLEKAKNVTVSREINGEYDLTFEYPKDKKSNEIKVNRLIECEGQFFRIAKTERSADGTRIIKITAKHIYNADAKAVHLQNVPDFIGKQPHEVLEYAFSGTGFCLMSDEELEALGLKRVDADGFLIDFFSVDKTTPYDVMETVIKNCGKGEIYIDNEKIALVDRIGKDSGAVLKIGKNIKNVTVERDISEMVTRLYPYGYEDLHIGSVNNGVQYIDSPNAAVYGIREGFRDYSDYKKPEDVFNRALWEFDAENKDRIDVPSVNISGSFAELSRLDKSIIAAELGDDVTVIDESTEIKERVIKIERHPFEPSEGSISVGHIKKDLFFYMNQMGKLNKSYKKASTVNGKIKAAAIMGVVNADGVNIKNSESGDVTVLSDLISISDSSGIRFICGMQSGTFTFAVYDKNGRAVYLQDNAMQLRGHINAESFKLGEASVTADTSGNLYINGKKIVTG